MNFGDHFVVMQCLTTQEEWTAGCEWFHGSQAVDSSEFGTTTNLMCGVAHDRSTRPVGLTVNGVCGSGLFVY